MIRVGIIGIGFGQHAHVPAFRHNEHCVVTGLCASTHDRARNVAERLGIPKYYGDWRILVDDPDIDAISIATPPEMQHEIAMVAFSKKKPVFCEKPLSTTLTRAEAMLTAAHHAGVPHMVDLEFGEIAQWQEAKALIQRGDLGNIRHAAVSWHVESYAARMSLKSWKTIGGASGGGVLNSFVSHVFHYVEWLLGDIHRLTAKTFSPHSREPSRGETEAILGLELAGGESVSVSVSNRACGGTGHRVEVYGEKGSLVLDNPVASGIVAFDLWRGDGRSLRLTPRSCERASSMDGRTAAVGQLVDRFVKWMRTGVAASPSFVEGVRIQYLLELARRSDKIGEWMTVPKECNGQILERDFTPPASACERPAYRPVEA